MGCISCIRRLFGFPIYDRVESESEPVTIINDDNIKKDAFTLDTIMETSTYQKISEWSLPKIKQPRTLFNTKLSSDSEYEFEIASV